MRAATAPGRRSTVGSRVAPPTSRRRRAAVPRRHLAAAADVPDRAGHGSRSSLDVARGAARRGGRLARVAAGARARRAAGAPRPTVDELERALALAREAGVAAGRPTGGARSGCSRASSRPRDGRLADAAERPRLVAARARRRTRVSRARRRVEAEVRVDELDPARRRTGAASRPRRDARASRHSRSRRSRSAFALVVVLSSRHPHTQTIVPLPAHARHDRRARPLGEHLVRHVLAHRRDARGALAQRRPLRARRLLGPGVRGAAAGHAGRRSRAARPLLHAADADEPGLRADVPAEPVGGDVQRRHEDLGRARARAPDRARRRAGRATVVLVSDLDDDPERPAAARLGPARLPARPHPAAHRRAEPVAGGRRALQAARSRRGTAIVARADARSRRRRTTPTPFPWPLVALVAAAAAALALRCTLWAPRLDWGRAMSALRSPSRSCSSRSPSSSPCSRPTSARWPRRARERRRGLRRGAVARVVDAADAPRRPRGSPARRARRRDVRRALRLYRRAPAATCALDNALDVSTSARARAQDALARGRARGERAAARRRRGRCSASSPSARRPRAAAAEPGRRGDRRLQRRGPRRSRRNEAAKYDLELLLRLVGGDAASRVGPRHGRRLSARRGATGAGGGQPGQRLLMALLTPLAALVALARAASRSPPRCSGSGASHAVRRVLGLLAARTPRRASCAPSLRRPASPCSRSPRRSPR